MFNNISKKKFIIVSVDIFVYFLQCLTSYLDLLTYFLFGFLHLLLWPIKRVIFTPICTGSRSLTVLCMKLNDIWVNPYNHVILKHWRAKMDIQLVGNAESCTFYACKYVCKAEPEKLRDTLRALF